MIVSSNQQRKGGGYGFGPLGTVADASGGTLPLYAAADPDDADPNRSHVALSLRIRRVRCCSPVAGMCSAMLGPHQVLYSQIMRHVFDDKDARKIFFFLVINVGQPQALLCTGCHLLILWSHAASVHVCRTGGWLVDQ